LVAGTAYTINATAANGSVTIKWPGNTATGSSLPPINIPPLATDATLTISLPPPTPDAGPATDFGITPFLESATGSVASANARMTLPKITDGTSNTIFAGHIYFATSEYRDTTPANSTRLPIFRGGTLATARNGQGDTINTWRQDGTVASSNQWG